MPNRTSARLDYLQRTREELIRYGASVSEIAAIDVAIRAELDGLPHVVHDPDDYRNDLQGEYARQYRAVAVPPDPYARLDTLYREHTNAVRTMESPTFISFIERAITEEQDRLTRTGARRTHSRAWMADPYSPNGFENGTVNMESILKQKYDLTPPKEKPALLDEEVYGPYGI